MSLLGCPPHFIKCWTLIFGGLGGNLNATIDRFFSQEIDIFRHWDWITENILGLKLWEYHKIKDLFIQTEFVRKMLSPRQ